jgi:hypothetical protein
MTIEADSTEDSRQIRLNELARLKACSLSPYCGMLINLSMTYRGTLIQYKYRTSQFQNLAMNKISKKNLIKKSADPTAEQIQTAIDLTQDTH